MIENKHHMTADKKKKKFQKSNRNTINTLGIGGDTPKCGETLIKINITKNDQQHQRLSPLG
jgi:hypothetical protein